MAPTVINIQAVEDGIASAEKQLAIQENTLNDIDKIISNMEGVWESESQKIYSDRFHSMKQKINNFNNSLNDYLKNMKDFVNDCVDVDDQTSKDLRSINW